MLDGDMYCLTYYDIPTFLFSFFNSQISSNFKNLCDYHSINPALTVSLETGLFFCMYMYILVNRKQIICA